MPPVVQTQVPGLTSYLSSSAFESASLSSMPDSQEPRPEDAMKAQMAGELKGAIHRVDLTAEGAIFQADSNTVQNVLGCLRRDHNLTPETLTGSASSPINPRLPEKGFGTEPPSYEPLVHLLNKIIDATHIPGSYLSGLRFHTFGKEVAEKYGSHKGLKPDGIGLIGNPPTDSKVKVSWEDIEITIESKGAIKQVIPQAATYARCCLVNNLRRFFALVIGFNFSSLEVVLLLIHRSGLSASLPLKLTEEQGFEGLVRHIVGILSIQEESAYRLDVTRSQDLFHINNRLYQCVHYIYIRGCLRGRATAVYSLKAHTGNVPPDMPSRRLSLTPGLDELPDQLVYKMAYPIKGSSQEGVLFSRAFGQFGIADVVGFYGCKPDEPHGSTKSLFQNATFIWKPVHGHSLAIFT